jgi:hypothetical protein
MPSFPTIAPAFLEEMVAHLLHLFIRGAGGDEAAARHAVLSTLAAYHAEDEQELRLAAEIISFGFAALEALAKAMNPDLPLNAVLRLRGNANAAHRSGHQCQRILDKLRKERRAAAANLPAPKIPARSAVSPEAVTASQPEPIQPAPQPDLSRQQRRELERKAVKAQRKEAERARLDARTASRIPSLSISAMHQAPRAAINQPF